uniref:Uncharacterized protein n=1 Tax=Myotis myotis TaxID=51298 RepID=A0A7J7SRB1_MYOMY|nr:hypothetical protein mMyoMyo1_009379 [Myotis myotis]
MLWHVYFPNRTLFIAGRAVWVKAKQGAQVRRGLEPFLGTYSLCPFSTMWTHTLVPCSHIIPLESSTWQCIHLLLVCISPVLGPWLLESGYKLCKRPAGLFRCFHLLLDWIEWRQWWGCTYGKPSGDFSLLLGQEEELCYGTMKTRKAVNIAMLAYPHQPWWAEEKNMCRMLVQLHAKSACGTLCSLPHPQTPFEDKFSLGPLPNGKGRSNGREEGRGKARKEATNLSQGPNYPWCFRITNFEELGDTLEVNWFQNCFLINATAHYHECEIKGI